MAFVLAGCGVVGSGPSTAEDPQVRSGELEDASGQVCPDELPLGEDASGDSFGDEGAADELPALLAPQEAWVCQYEIVDLASAAGGGDAYDWKLSRGPEPVSAERLPTLSDALDGLSVIDRRGACTADLGPRTLVVWNHDGDLTAAVVDNYGCRSVRLTDDPHSTPPGADDQEGTVAGILDGGQAVLDALGGGATS